LASKNVLILAGGGGHTAYGYALAQRLYGKANLHFLVPEGDKLSFERLSKFGAVEFLLKPREAKTPTREFIPRLMKAFVEAAKKVSNDFDVVVSTGSNFCIPPCLFAWIKGTPIVNIESSVRFTKASKIRSFVTAFFSYYCAALGGTEETAKKRNSCRPINPKTRS
jgi:UDP-N-acetylglucosamine:LPS N-acetylglucosamine transferase